MISTTSPLIAPMGQSKEWVVPLARLQAGLAVAGAGDRIVWGEIALTTPFGASDLR